MAQLHKTPHLDDEPVGTELIIGPRAKKPLKLEIPIFVSDMSFALSAEAKVALAKGAEMAGTGICSGEGGMLLAEAQSNSRYFYELASARFGFSYDNLEHAQAFHFKGGQGAKTGTGGHLPGSKVTKEIAAVRGLRPGEPAARFPDWETIDDFAKVAEVRKETGGIPSTVTFSGYALRRFFSLPTIPALVRARKYLNETGNSNVTLIATGGLRTAADFAKALALGADGVAAVVSGCGHVIQITVLLATQKAHLRSRLQVRVAAQRLNRFLGASVSLMQVLARACGHTHLDQFDA